MKKILNQGIVAIQPQYLKDKGNCTIIWTQDKTQHILEKTIKTTIRNICSHYHLDLLASNKTYGDLLSIKKSPPIPFTQEDIFIIMKTREPLYKDDGAHGYFKLEEISKVKKLKASPNKTIIYLKNGLSLEACCKEETVKRKIKEGEILKQLIERKAPILNRNTSLLAREDPHLYHAQSTPATKSDLALIYMCIMELKTSLEAVLERGRGNRG